MNTILTKIDSTTEKLMALVTLNGLAICCFNDGADPKEWQAAFLHPTTGPEHNLSLIIRHDKSIIHQSGIQRGSSITINATGSSVYSRYPDGYHPASGPFDRHSPTSDPNDFRWVFDLNNKSEFPHSNLNLRSPAPFPVTLAHIQNIVLYTNKLTEQELYRVRRGDDPNTPAAHKHLLGKANKEIGGLLFGDSVTISFTDHTGETATTSLSATDGPYKIELNNTCLRASTKLLTTPVRLEEGDLKFYYDAVDTDQQWSLWGVPSIIFVGRVDCNGVGLSGFKDLTVLQKK